MFGFTLRQIEIFLAICEAGGFRGAADRLGISEAGVSNHVRALERQLDCLLFARRRGARATLLEAGHAFREEAQGFLERGRDLRAAAQRHRAAPLRVFVGGHLLEDFVRPALPRLAAAHPEIDLHFVVDRPRARVRRDMAAGAYDVVLLAVRDADDVPDSVLLARIEGGIYGDEHHAARMRAHGLAGLPFILGSFGTDEDRQERRALARLGVEQPIVALRAQFHDARISNAANGLGVTMSLRSIVDAHDKARRLVLLRRVSDWQCRLHVGTRMDPETRRILVAFFSETVAALAGDASD